MRSGKEQKQEKRIEHKATPVIKICGLRRAEDVTLVNKWRPDLVGFVFAPSKRLVSFEEAGRLKALLSPEIAAAGVFVDETVQRVAEAVSRRLIDVVQLHGREDNSYIASLRKLLRKQAGGDARHVPVIQAFRVETREDLLRADDSEADFLLLDHGSGGTGKSFDWSLLDGDARPAKPFFLAGGLGPENAAEAVRRIRPFGIDMSSGVETEGKKDGRKIEAVMRSVRR